ncbi:hypothetical protein I5U35_05685 [Stenotrophomonas maltophilia]|nr:hypothetical protein [Stenotrophomonas maltophilia]
MNGLLERLNEALARERRFVAAAAHELPTRIGALKVHADNAGLASEGTAMLKARGMVEKYAGYLERLMAQL